MEQTTLIFGGIVILIVLLLLWLLRKYIGRLILIIFFLFMLWGILYFIKPDLALNIWHDIVDLPKMFEKVEKSDVIDELPSVAVETPELSQIPEVSSEVLDDNAGNEQKYSWFASFFGFGKSGEPAVVETIVSEEKMIDTKDKVEATFSGTASAQKSKQSALQHIELEDEIVLSETPIQDLSGSLLSTGVIVSEDKEITGDSETSVPVTSTSVENNQLKEELILDPSEYTVSVNEKGMIVVKAREEGDVSVFTEAKKDEPILPQKKNPVQQTSQKGLSAQDLREANQIFNL